MGRMAEGRWRLTAHAAAALLIVAALTACTPDPTPTPSPTGFASDEEAFAAAEDTYRAYIDALSARQTGDESVDPLDFLTGQALEDAINSDRQLELEQLELSGPITVTSIEPKDATDYSASAHACVDMSQARVLDASGTDITPPTREDQFSVDIEAIWTGAGTLISQSTPSEQQC